MQGSGNQLTGLWIAARGTSNSMENRCPWNHASLNRRETLRVGAIGLLGLGCNHLAAFRQASAATVLGIAGGSSIPRLWASQVLHLRFPVGGLAQHESFDMKPLAPDTNRGEFYSDLYLDAGLEICEHLPKLAQCSKLYSYVGVSLTLPMIILGPSQSC